MQRVPTVPTLEKGLRASIRPVLRSEEHTSELQSQSNLVCRLLLEKKNSPQLLLSPRAIVFLSPPNRAMNRSHIRAQPESPAAHCLFDTSSPRHISTSARPMHMPLALWQDRNISLRRLPFPAPSGS